MGDNEFAGYTSEETHLGVLTHTDSEYNYVWAPHLKTLELRYPLNPQLAFQPGDAVRFLQQKDGRGPQIVHDLVKEKDYKLEVMRELTKNGTIAWKAKVNMVFAPQNNERLRKMREIDEGVQWLAFTDNFMEVLCFLKELDVIPGVVYEGYVTRLPEPFITLGKKMGSLFCVKHRQGTPFKTVVTDRNEIEELMSRCPFANEVTTNEHEDIGLSSHRLTSNETNRNQSVERISNSSRDNSTRNDVANLPEEDVTINYATRLEDFEEGIPSLGLIVRTADEYAVIWSPTHDLVRIQLPSGAELKQQNQRDEYTIATWVHYRCFEEQSQLHHGVRCNYTAYFISPASRNDRVVSTCTTEYGTEVVMQCFLTNPKEHNNQLFHAMDSFVGQVICPHDRWLKEQVQKSDSVQVMAIFTDEYKHRWIAFAMEKQSDVYQKLDELPAVIDAKVQPFFNRVGARKTLQHDEQMHLMNIGARFKPPLDWKGPKECGNTVVNVLGVTIGSERNDTMFVIATSYGIARQPKRLELGTWVEATIQMENDEQAACTHSYESFMHEHTYRVLFSKKISPPMSTRVVTKNGAERLLLCGDVGCIVNGLRNAYLGRVEDVKHHINAKPGDSYLVEVGITRHPDNNRLNCFWNVLKFHGKSVKNVHKIPLQLSVYSTAEGKTCDDAHRILIDQTFDAKDHIWDAAPTVAAYVPSVRPLAAVQQREEMREDLHNNSMSSVVSKSKEQKWVDLPEVASVAVNNSSSPFDVNLDAFTVNRNAVGATATQPPPSAMGSTTASNHNASAIFAFEKKMTTTTNSSTNTTKYANGESDESAVLAELAYYEPSSEKKRTATGLVVRKRPEYLLMYNAKYGLGILLAKFADVQSACEFEEKFALGEFYSCSFVRVAAERGAHHLTYEWMCKGDFKLVPPLLKTRLIMGRFLHVNVVCNFTKENLLKLYGDHYILKTDLGNVRLGKDFLIRNDLFNKAANVWVAFVKETEGCHWEIVQDSWGSLMDDEPPPEIYTHEQDDFVIVHNQQQQSQDEHAAEELHNKLHGRVGYVDFLFGADVCDGIGGERYQSQRLDMANDSEGDEDSDDDRPLSNWDDSSTTSADGRSDFDEGIGGDGPFDFGPQSADDDFEKNLRVIGGSSPPCN